MRIPRITLYKRNQHVVLELTINAMNRVLYVVAPWVTSIAFFYLVVSPWSNWIFLRIHNQKDFGFKGKLKGKCCIKGREYIEWFFFLFIFLFNPWPSSNKSFTQILNWWIGKGFFHLQNKLYISFFHTFLEHLYTLLKIGVL